MAAASFFPPSRTRSIVGVNIIPSSYQQVVEKSLAWAEARDSRALLFTNVHVVMEAFDDRGFRSLLNQADMVNPDGIPLVWALRLLGERQASRVYGPDATLAVLAAAARERIPVGFYGSSPRVMELLLAEVRELYPELQVVFQETPPFRELTAAEDEAVVGRIAASGARMLFVGLGCPKQESWIMAHKGRVPAVMFGVGAAFDFIAKTKPQAPRWMMRVGLEWLFRLSCEPRRLARRYFKHNPRFIALLVRQLVWRQA